MDTEERRRQPGPDRRRVPRGGRRATDQPGRHPRVIVADSYDGARRPCIRYLDHFNFDVAAAADGKALLDQVVARSPAVILLDSQLERSSRGLLNETSGLEKIPVILFVGGVAEASEPDQTAVRAAASLVKPFPLAAMLETIRSVLRAQVRAAMALN
jgi:DNA-binding response OmpR family regulator